MIGLPIHKITQIHSEAIVEFVEIKIEKSITWN